LAYDCNKQTHESRPVSSTDRQTVENQRRSLEEVARHRTWEVVATYSDKGLSGMKGRKDRPEFDRMLRDAQRGRFDVVMAFALDRVGRSPCRPALHHPESSGVQG